MPYNPPEDVADYLPYKCKLDRQAKRAIFRKGEEGFRREFTEKSRNQKGRFLQTIFKAKSPGIDIVRSHICIHCHHQYCELRPVKDEAEVKAENSKPETLGPEWHVYAPMIL